MTDEPSIGHNSSINKEAKDRLKSMIDRIENLTEEKKGLSTDISDIFKEAKGAGFDTAAMKKLIKARLKSPEEVQTETMVFETYCRAMGMANYLE